MTTETNQGLQREVSKTSDDKFPVVDAVPAVGHNPDARASADAVRGLDEAIHEKTRPPMDFSSTGAFFSSFGRRFKSLWTKQFIFALIAGQLLSLCITSTSVITTELSNRDFNLPTTQTFFLYFTLNAIYTPYTIYQYGLRGWGLMVLKDGWKYLLLAAADVEGNFLVVKAFQHTNLLSAMLLDTWAIPVCMLVTYIWLRTKFHWTQYLGVFVCCVGMALGVISDRIQASEGPGESLVKGDLFMLAGATLYGITNATEEYFVRKSPLYQVVGQLGFWGMIINGVQAAGLEHKEMREAPWNGATIGFIVVYTAAMLFLYTLAPILYRKASSTFFNLSILSSDFFGLCFGLGLYHLNPYWLYFVAFVVVLIGLVVYFWHTAPEEGKVEAQPPAYVNARFQKVKEDQVV